MPKFPKLSKKLVAFFYTQTIYAVLLIVLFATQEITIAAAFLGGIIALSMGVVSVGYVISQSAIDKLIVGVGKIASFGQPIELDDEEY